MGDFFMQINVDALNDIYQNAQMGIVGIDDVLNKTKNPKLYKELLKEKKEYQKILKSVKKMISDEHGTVKEINLMAKIGSEIYSEMKLMKNENDKFIIKMMIEGSYKSIGILTTKRLSYEHASNDVKKIMDDFISKLNTNIDTLKKIDKIC